MASLLLGDWDIKYLHHQGDEILEGYPCTISLQPNGTLAVPLRLSDETILQLEVREFLPGICTFIHDEKNEDLYMGSLRLLMTGNLLIMQGVISRRRKVKHGGSGGDDMGTFTATKPIGTVYS